MFCYPLLSRAALDDAGGKKLRHRSNLALLGQFGYESTVSIFDMRHWISSLLKACKRWVVAETFGLHEKEKSLWVKTEDENAIHPRTVSQLAECCIDDVHMPLLFRAGRNFVLDFCRWGELKQQNG